MLPKLFKDTDSLKSLLPINNDFKLPSLDNYFQMPLNTHILPICSKALFADLYTKYQNDQLTDPLEQEVWNTIQRAAAPLGFYKYLPFSQVQISNSGIRIKSDENYKTAFKWQVQDIEKALVENGFQAMEDLSTLLLDNKAELPLYHSSSEYITHKLQWVQRASTFATHIGSQVSAYVFHRLRHKLERQNRRLRETLTNNLYIQIRAEQANESFTANSQNLIDLFIPAICFSAFAEAIPELRLEITPEGIVQPSTEKNNPVKDQLIMEFCHQTKQEAEQRWQEITDFLESNNGDFPQFISSNNEEYSKKNFNIGNERGFFFGG